MTLISRTEPQSREQIIAEMKTMRPRSDRWNELNDVLWMMTLAGLHEAAFPKAIEKDFRDGL
ncbi:hypothetical protein [Aureimonas glaciei]|uniref:Uncharacterized protein n=1 Tax=Aureimonas glaciei TaxID=1776957 RepID=A0A917D8F0_9HYPH|nr:hypothetical protein [Aureimonas glaciei]GGD11818.1 hypothetical protein GCM10011335_13480 [Aureimonas glaciei]